MRRGVTAVELGGMLYGLPDGATQEDIEMQIRAEVNASAQIIYTAVNRLMTELGAEDVLWLYRNPERVVEWVEGSGAPPSPASKIIFYKSLASVASPRKEETRDISARVSERSRKMFLERAQALAQRVRLDDRRNLLDERERVAILPWPAIQTAYRKNKHLLNDSQSVIAALYLAGGTNPAGAPRRLDYNAIRIYHKDPDNNPSTNYVVVRSADDVVLVLSEFKTSKRYGLFQTKLPVAVSRVIHDSVTRHPRTWLVQAADGGPISAAAFGHRLAATLKRLTGRRIGASNLRKSFISWITSDPDVTAERLEAFAKAMNHSPAEQKLYRRHDITDVHRKIEADT